MVTPRAIGGPDQDPDEIIDPSPRPHHPNGLRFRDVYCLKCRRFHDYCECPKPMRSIRDIFRSRAQFDAQGRHIWGTDRESNHHFGDAYDKLFYRPVASDSPLSGLIDYISTRADVRLMLEVGVADGSSLLAWREVFPNATVVGLDQNYPCIDWVSKDGVEFHLGDARDRRDCERAALGCAPALGARHFDLIVDDASHHLPDVLTTLFWLWPFVRAGGLYVVEDMQPAVCDNFTALWPGAQVVDTRGPFGGVEPLIVLRKPT